MKWLGCLLAGAVTRDSLRTAICGHNASNRSKLIPIRVKAYIVTPGFIFRQNTFPYPGCAGALSVNNSARSAAVPISGRRSSRIYCKAAPTAPTLTSLHSKHFPLNALPAFGLTHLVTLQDPINALSPPAEPQIARRSIEIVWDKILFVRRASERAVPIFKRYEDVFESATVRIHGCGNRS